MSAFDPKRTFTVGDEVRQRYFSWRLLFGDV
jgi:hypothetical protein